MAASDLLQKIIIGAKKVGTSIVQDVGTASEFVRKNPITSGVSVAGGVLAGATIVQIVRKRRKAAVKKKTAKRKPSRKPTQRRKTKSRTMGRGKGSLHRTRVGGKATRHKHRGTKKIHITKKGQPYIILASGKARFIKKSSASRMRKLKGGFR